MVEWAALEMRYTGNCIGGSNPPASAPEQRIALREDENAGAMSRQQARPRGGAQPESGGPDERRGRILPLPPSVSSMIVSIQGGVAEWSNAPHLKCGVSERVP